MIGHYLLTLTDLEADRVMTQTFQPILPPLAQGGPCLCLLIGREQESSRGVFPEELYEGRTRGTRGRTRMPGHVYEDLCVRFGVPRINVAIRNRILANQAQRTLSGIREPSHLRVTVRVLNELEAVKRLLILQLVISGVRVDDVGRSLGMTRRDLLKVIPLKWIVRERHIA